MTHSYNSLKSFENTTKCNANPPKCQPHLPLPPEIFVGYVPAIGIGGKMKIMTYHKIVQHRYNHHFFRKSCPYSLNRPHSNSNLDPNNTQAPGASIPSETMMHFPLCLRFSPYFRKIFRL